MWNIMIQTSGKDLHAMHELQLCDDRNSMKTSLVSLHHSLLVWFHVSKMCGECIELFQSAIHCFMLGSNISFHLSVRSPLSHVWGPQLLIIAMSCIAFNSFIIKQKSTQVLSEDDTVVLPSSEWTIDPDNQGCLDAHCQFMLEAWSIELV